MKSLLTNFVEENWVTLIDFSSMKVKTSTFKGISEDKRESDLLLEFSLKDNTKILIFILIEFQSTYEQIMLRLNQWVECDPKEKREKPVKSKCSLNQSSRQAWPRATRRHTL